MKRGRCRAALLCACFLAASVLSPAATASAVAPTESIVMILGTDSSGQSTFGVFGTALIADGELCVLTAIGPADLEYKARGLEYDTIVDVERGTARDDVGVMFVTLKQSLPGVVATDCVSADNAQPGSQFFTIGVGDGILNSFMGIVDASNGNNVMFSLTAEVNCVGSPLCYPDGTVFAFVTSIDGNKGTAVKADVFLNGESGITKDSSGDKIKDMLMKYGIPALAVIAVVVLFLLFRSKTKKTAPVSHAYNNAPPDVYNQVPPDMFSQPQQDIYNQTPPGMYNQSQPDMYVPQQPNTFHTAPSDTYEAPPYTYMPPQTFNYEAPAAPQVQLTGIRGTGGQYNTMMFPIKDRVVLGRDPSRCGIVFEASTPGVSSVHCEIIRVGPGLQLVDRGSSYGTFADGAKILVNSPVDLGSGSVFYLGDKRNSFTTY